MNRTNRPPAGESFVWLTRDLIRSDAWRSLGINVRRFIDFLWLEHMAKGGQQNGKLKAPHRQLEKFGISVRGRGSEPPNRHLSIQTTGDQSMKASLIAASALAAAIGLPLIAKADEAPVPTGFTAEKCYGVAKAGLNDCQTASHSCAATSTKDKDHASWIYVPAGTCQKIAGGSTKPI
jgi:uncharacterized membrane protein